MSSVHMAAETELPAKPLSDSMLETSDNGDTCGDLNMLDALGAPITYKEPEENLERGNWSNQVEFLLACIGYAIGLGNIWRFPYIVYQYGGGSFLVAYWLIFFVVAFPAFYLELALGQFTSSGPVAIFRCLVPAFEGLGASSLIVQIGTSFYYNGLFAVALFYAFASIKMEWKHCNSPWNSNACFSIEDYQKCVKNPMESWWLKGECYHNSNITDFYRKFDKFCLTNPATYKSSPFKIPRCILQLKLCFKGDFTPTKWLGVNMNESMFKEEKCKDLVPFKVEQLGEKFTEPKSLMLDMTGDEGKKNAELLKASGLSFVDLMSRYCEEWKDGKASGCFEGDKPVKQEYYIPCARAVIRPKEFYSSQEYYNNHIFNPESSFTDLKGFYWPLPLALVLSVVLVGLGVLQGPKWMGKAVYVTSILPVVSIFILIIYVVTLKGHQKGIQWYLRTEWCKLKDPSLWLEAMGQIFFSLSIGSGGLMTLASYNRFHQDLLRNSFIIALSNCIFSFITGFGIFGAVGYMAEIANTEVPEVLRGSSSALAFVTLAQTVATMPASVVWGVLFFMTLAFLAIDSVFAMVETVLAFLYDTYPQLRLHRIEVVSICAIVLFICGLPFVSRGGQILIGIVDGGLYNWVVPLIAAFQLIMVAWIYGLRNFAKDIDMILGGPSGKARTFGSVLWKNFVFREYMLFVWLIPAPLGIFIMMFATVYKIAKDGKLSFSTTEGAFTILFAVSTPVLLCGTIIYRMAKGKTCNDLMKPTADWGPALNVHRALDPERYCLRQTENPCADLPQAMA